MQHDAPKRLALRDALGAYLRNEIRTFAFDDANSECMDTDDASLKCIANHLYIIHDDTVDHPISVSETTWQCLIRIAAFLRTNLLCQTGTDQPYWPFQTRELWLEHKSANDDLRIPDYDPQSHQPPIHGRLDRIPTIIGVTILVGLVIIAFAVVVMAN